MEKQKALVINCALCDTRKVSEETLAPFDKVTVNCATVLASEASRLLLGKKMVTINCADVRNVGEEVAVTQINGSSQIKPGPALANSTLLIVNGSLDIEPGCEEVLRSYDSIYVNGSVTCPESLAGLVGQKAAVNGSIETYPDEAIRLKKTVLLDRTFPLRAREKGWYYARRVIALDPQADFARLAELGVRFSARRLLVAEGLAKDVAALFDERTDIVFLPDGCVYLAGDATLTRELVERKGGKLYIQGDLTVNQESASCLDQIEYLQVAGDLLVTPGMMERMRRVPVECDSWLLIGGLLLGNREDIQLTRSLLEGAPEGVSAFCCEDITLAEDVSPELLREKLVSLMSCGDVICTQEQADAIQAVCKNCGDIGPKKQKSESKAQEEEAWEITRINCATYTM